MSSLDTATSSGFTGRSWPGRFLATTAVLNGLLGPYTATTAGYSPVPPPTGTAAVFPNQVLVQRAKEESTRPATKALLEVRRLSALTWQELADLLQVNRRTVHLWANGRPINAANEHRLQRLLGVMRRLDRGEAKRNRGLLLEPTAGGESLYDLLSDERFEQAIALVGAGTGRQRGPATPLAFDAVEARRPTSPPDLLGALQDRVHRSDGRLVRHAAERLRVPKKV